MTEYIKLSDVARKLQITVKTLYTWKAAGRIKFTKIGNRNRITADELARFIAANNA